MTKQATVACLWCGEPFPKPKGPGRPRVYCRRSHRQRHYEAKLIGERRGLNHDEVLVSRRVWTQLRDALYRLESASEDVAMDVMRGNPTKTEYVAALAHLSEAVRELQDVAVEPIAVSDEASLTGTTD